MKKRNSFSPTHKAKIACAALRENKTVNEISAEHGVHSAQINQWRKTVVENSHTLFERKNSKRTQEAVDVEELKRIVGEQTIQLAWYKKKLGHAA